MTHRDASRTPTSRGQADRAVPAVRRPSPTGAQRGGFTESELALIHATAGAHGLAIDICTVVVPDGTFPPTPDGAPRPEVARILASLRKNTPPQTQPQGRAADLRAVGQSVAADAAAHSHAVGVPASLQSGLVSGVAYDRQAHDLEASRRLAVSTDGTTHAARADLTAVADHTLEAGRG